MKKILIFGNNILFCGNIFPDSPFIKYYLIDSLIFRDLLNDSKNKVA